ncbi:MAG: hypothetical protein NVS4B6_04850 [Mycobacterium sp.]
MDPKDRIPHDDWADQDLLTRGEAAERLAAEIKEIRAKMVTGDSDEVMLRRLAALEESFAQMTSTD